ncbi:MAG TPA: acyl carrier protein [Ignavibacteriaceae bacterium]|jgi:acyl carrier protein|nr:acyl carrier protein [Ignavibacteriaceae bacterium]
MDIVDIIKEFIIDNFLFGESNHFDENTDLFEKGILDSTGIIELVGFIEKTFNITIDDEELITDNFSSLSRITRYLQMKLAFKAS